MIDAQDPVVATAPVLQAKDAPLKPSLSLGLASVIALIVLFGFAQTFDKAVLHPRIAPPSILHLHIALFGAWVLLFLAQSAFIRFRRRRWHRQLGVLGFALGLSMLLVGVTTAIQMAHFHAAGGKPHSAASLAIPFADMWVFGSTFGLGIFWRHRPAFHARLMVLASCALTAAAFARFPSWLVPNHLWYLAVEVLVLVALLLDWSTTRRIHPTFAIGLPAMAAFHATAMWLAMKPPAWWLKTANTIFNAT